MRWAGRGQLFSTHVLVGNSDSVCICGDRALLLCVAVSSLTLERSDRDHCVLALNGTV